LPKPENGELVQIADSQLVRTTLEMTNRVVSESMLADLSSRKKILTRKKNNPASQKALVEIAEKLDFLLFIPELINVQFEDKRHYGKIINRGGILRKRCSLCTFHGKRRTDTPKLSSIYENF